MPLEDRKEFRLVSANMDTKKAIKSGNKGNNNQPAFCWKKTMEVKLKELTTRMIGRMIRLNEISYEIIWAAERNDPIKAYFELLAHPLKIIPYTPRDEMAKTKRTPRGASITTS